MKSTKLKIKTEKGITLIALIITIVVLMILAAVAINSITNDGILSQAGSTANRYNQAVKDEESYLQDYEDMLTAANGGYATYEVGAIVKIGTEEFYVIEDKTSLGKVELLAKECIDTTTLVQSASANGIEFSETYYWSDDIEGDYYNYDLNETGEPDASHYALRAAYDYGVKIGGTGRLMTYDEAETLSSGNEAMIHGTDSYWLSTASGERGASDADNWDGLDTAGGDGFAGGSDISNDLGVRPVIEISKSKVTKVQ